MRILVLGASGMIGSAVYRVLSQRTDRQVFGTIRAESWNSFFSSQLSGRLIADVDLTENGCLQEVFSRIHPEVVVNCVGLTKHKAGGNEPLTAIALNALLPHQLVKLCTTANARLIHISTDCVFSGKKGNYSEDDVPDAVDIYGRSKALGEVNQANAITLRTSTIGHELRSNYGLLDWFLSQTGSCKGYTRAIFSGLPTVIFARVISDVVIPRNDLSGLYNVAAAPIAKYDLLRLIAEVYGKSINIIPDDNLVIDRSLDASLFNAETGYQPPGWPELISLMNADMY